MLNNIEAIIFDLDGTLVDSMWMWHQIDIDYLGRFNIEIPDGLQDSIEGMSFSETAIYFKNNFKIPDSVEKIKSDWNEMAYEYYKTKVILKKGALDLLKYCRLNGIKTGIATSNSIELLNAVIESLNLKEYFDSMHVSCEVGKGKPAPDIYLYVAKDLNVSPEKCLVFEDISAGVLAGKAAGMKTCGVYDDFAAQHNDRIELITDYYIRDFTEVFNEKVR